MATFLVLYDAPADPAAFDRHYREVHVPLALALPGLRRFTISHDVRGLGSEPCHLVARLEWDSVAQMHAALASPEGRAAGADLANLPATVRSMTFDTEELVRPAS